MRKPYVAGNWKMNLDLDGAVQLAAAIAGGAASDGVEVGMAPPAVYLAAVAQAVEGTGVHVAAQNCYFEASGAFTGEIAPQMVSDAGGDSVILGHSERRHVFGETDEMINKKVIAALGSGLNVILCIGELLEEREAGQTEAVCKRHVTEGLNGIDTADTDRVVIAYEPVWAIGTGKTATPDQAQEVHAYVRSLVAELYGGPVAEALRIQYGGSVKPDNAGELMGQKDVDGALVGGASLKADSFLAIIEAARQAKGVD